MNRDRLFSNRFHTVKYFYAEARPEGLGSIEYHRGMPSEIKNNPDDGHALFIFDDLMSEASNDALRNAFIRTSHHQLITVVLIIQNLFFKSPVARDISLNTKYMVSKWSNKFKEAYIFIFSLILDYFQESQRLPTNFVSSSSIESFKFQGRC